MHLHTRRAASSPPAPAPAPAPARPSPSPPPLRIRRPLPFLCWSLAGRLLRRVPHTCSKESSKTRSSACQLVQLVGVLHSSLPDAPPVRRSSRSASATVAMGGHLCRSVAGCRQHSVCAAAELHRRAAAPAEHGKTAGCPCCRGRG